VTIRPVPTTNLPTNHQPNKQGKATTRQILSVHFPQQNQSQFNKVINLRQNNLIKHMRLSINFSLVLELPCDTSHLASEPIGPQSVHGLYLQNTSNRWSKRFCCSWNGLRSNGVRPLRCSQPFTTSMISY